MTRLRARHVWPLLACLPLGLACEPEQGPWMTPGEDCLSCHFADGVAEKKIWSVGGTVYDAAGAAASGAQIVVTDADGRSITMVSNGAGNFYTGEALKEPLRAVSVLRAGKQRDMPMPASGVPVGACNTCHVAGGKAGARIVAP